MTRLVQGILVVLLAAPFPAGAKSPVHRPATNPLAIQFAKVRTSLSPDHQEVSKKKQDLDNCRSHEVKSLPGSHEFASNFIETIATDPDSKPRNRNAVWGLTADLSTEVPADKRAMYISKSLDGGDTWT